MPDKSPLLTIAIPTYNRAEYLRESLNLLFDQVRENMSVELLISDNASDDDTSSVVHELQERGLRLTYLRNAINIGSDANFLQCFESATGKYVLLLGDDDILLPGGLSRIVSALAAGDYALVYLCPYPFRNDYLVERRHDKFNRFSQTFSNGLSFIRHVGTTIAFISAMIINKDNYLSKTRPELGRLVDSNLMHLGWLLPVLSDDRQNLIIWERLLAARSGNTGGWGICAVFSERLFEVLNWTLPDRPDISAALMNCTLQNWFPFMIIEVRRSTAGQLWKENFCQILQPRHKWNWRYWFFIFPVAAAPYWFARAWYLQTQLLNRGARFLRLIVSFFNWRKNVVWDSE